MAMVTSSSIRVKPLEGTINVSRGIIAIISVVAVALFGNVQASARDAKRKSELEAIASVLEVNKTSGGAYNPITANKFGGGNWPGPSAVEALDPQNYPYCISSTTTAAPPSDSALTAWASTSPGPSSCSTTAPAVGTTYSKFAGTVPAATTISWKICTRLEAAGGTVFCRTNTQ